MTRYRVLLTDIAWPDVDLETAVLADANAELVLAGAQDEATLAGLAADVDAIMTTWAQVTRRVIAACPRCRIVARLGVGLDNIDVDYCTQVGIPVTNVPDYCRTEVAEHTLALLFALARKAALYHWQTKSGRYDLQEGPPLRRIAGQTLGVVGLGGIGSAVAAKALALGLRVIAVNRSGRNPIDQVEMVDLETLLRRSDYVSLHVPLTPQTRGLLGAPQFRLMKQSACLINTARGGVVDHQALAEALQRGEIAGAALDVQDPEPPDLKQPPYNHPSVIVTPHTAFSSVESLAELRRRAATQVAACLSGKVPKNVVNPAALQC